MKRSILFGFSLVVLLAVVISGCSKNSTGESPEALPEGSLQNNALSANLPKLQETKEFGYRVEGTECVKQLHGGCVPSDYERYGADILGLHFQQPLNWNSVSASEREVSLMPRERDGSSDPTQLFVWRAGIQVEDYQAIKETLIDSGKSKIDYFDVDWKIYTGEWNGEEVQSEWVMLTADPDNPKVNYVFFLLTEPENFPADQMVLRAAVSSIVEKEFKNP